MAFNHKRPMLHFLAVAAAVYLSTFLQHKILGNAIMLCIDLAKKKLENSEDLTLKNSIPFEK